MDGPSNPNYECDSSPLFDRSWNHSGITPEKRLWCACLIVLVRDVQDAYDAWRNSTNGHSKELRLNLLRLIDESMSESVGIICGYADIDHSIFIKRCQRISEGVERSANLNRNFY